MPMNPTPNQNFMATPLEVGHMAMKHPVVHFMAFSFCFSFATRIICRSNANASVLGTGVADGDTQVICAFESDADCTERIPLH